MSARLARMIRAKVQIDQSLGQVMALLSEPLHEDTDAQGAALLLATTEMVRVHLKRAAQALADFEAATREREGS